MHPILLFWGGLSLRSFHVMIYVASLVTVFVTVALAQRDGIDAERSAIAVVLLLVPGFIVSRLFYVARHWPHFRDDPARIVRRSEGGLSLYGGFIGIFVGAVPILWLLGVPMARFMDALLLGMMAGLAVAKGGCLLNGCCYGRATDAFCGLHLPDDRGRWRRRYPTQLIEMAWAVAVLILMLAWWQAGPPAGLIACATVALHPAGRIIWQTLRDEGEAENAAVRRTCIGLSATAVLAGLLILTLG